MAQSTILAAGTTLATSSDVVVVNAPCSIGLFVASGALPSELNFEVIVEAGAVDNVIANLNRDSPTLNLVDAGTYRVKRVSVGRAGIGVGVYKDPAAASGVGTAASEITNDSGVVGTTVKDALDTGKAASTANAASAATGIANAATAQAAAVAAAATANANAAAIAALPALAFGTYTPVLTAVANVAASALPFGDFTYMRVGNIVHVAGYLSIDPTAAADTQLEVSLPIPTNIAAAGDLAGTACAPLQTAANAASAGVYGSVANDRAVIRWIAVGLANAFWMTVFQYQIKA